MGEKIQKIYNSDAKVDWTVLEELKHKPIYTYMNKYLSLVKFNRPIKKLSLHKAPGKNGVSPNAIKALNDKNKSYLFDICADYFNNDLSIDDWQIGCLKILPKKGNLSDPSNWRGVNLLRIASKFMSLVITFRLQYILKSEGALVRFGASSDTGCPEGSFSLKITSNS